MINASPTTVQPYRKDFILIVIGQIISLFGNAILRFALPLYILQQSGSPRLFAIVSAVAFIPMIMMSPVGGILADRVHKQRIMVVLDFFTAALMLGYLLLAGRLALAPLMIAVMMLLYAVQGMYQPTVQASLPALLPAEKLVSANAVVNLVQSLSGLLGPVLGGFLLSFYGLTPIVQISILCFTASAVMELFIRIPHKRQPSSGGILKTAATDMRSSMHFLFTEKPVMIKVIGLVCAFNLFLSTLLIIGLPVLITQGLGLSEQYYGYTEGLMGLGGLVGGILVGVVGKRLEMKHAYITLLVCALCLFPMAIVLVLPLSTMLQYGVLTGASFLMMVGATIFTVQTLAFVQMATPAAIVGKVIACLMALTMCAQPMGQILYGQLFEKLPSAHWLIILAAAFISCLIALYSKATFRQLDNTPANSQPILQPQE